MALTYKTSLKAKLVDCYDLQWDMNGKKGTTPIVVLYCPEDHRTYQIPQACELGKCNIDGEYAFEIEMTEKYGKNKKKIVGVH